MAAEASNDPGAALARLKTLIEADTAGVDAHELIRLADLAASAVTDSATRETLAEMLIAALSVIRFAPILGNDTAPARRHAEAVIAAIAAASG